eukprot:TRINITY_DN285_c0_g1_i3.p2 TRINITY_DN285_c0_g1~~TRINITY_DN285_c0_g1_i3.p2  ORF type:complete len:128 (-),score=56.25 TRINITY_DN285_c0_g1_i3:103-486(-)
MPTLRARALRGRAHVLCRQWPYQRVASHASTPLLTPAASLIIRGNAQVNGKAGDLGDAVTITREADRLVVVAQLPFSKRYLKYLTKKYLKKQSLRDYLRVVATKKDTYEMRYFSIAADGDADAAEED